MVIKGKVLDNQLKMFDSGRGYCCSLVEAMVFSPCLADVLGDLFKEHSDMFLPTSLWSEIIESFDSYLGALLVFGVSEKLLSYLDTVGGSSRLELMEKPLQLKKSEVELIFRNALGDQRVKLRVLFSQLVGKDSKKLEVGDMVDATFRQKAINARVLNSKILSCHNRFTEKALKQDQNISPDQLSQLQCYLLLLHHSFGTIQDYPNLTRPGSDTEYIINIGLSCMRFFQKREFIKLVLKAKSILGGLSGARAFFERETRLSVGLSPEERALGIEEALQKLETIKGKGIVSYKEPQPSTSLKEPQSSTSQNVESAAARLQPSSSSIAAADGNKVRDASLTKRLKMSDQTNKKEPMEKKSNEKAGNGVKLKSDDDGENLFSSSTELFKAHQRSSSGAGFKSDISSVTNDKGGGSSSRVQQHSRSAPAAEQVQKRSRSTLSTSLFTVKDQTSSQDQSKKHPDSSNESIKPQRSKAKLSLDDSLEQSDDRLYSDK